MNFRSFAQLGDQVLSWSKNLPSDIDLVVGIPRSGLLVANLLALYRNIPLTDVEGFIEGRVIPTGRWRRSAKGRVKAGDSSRQFLTTARNVLVVDDSVGSGKSIREIKDRIEAANVPHRIQYAAVYVAPEMEHAVDYFREVLHFPRVFEWNVLHHRILNRSCLDMDGVLCFDPRDRDNDDGERYRQFVQCARPLLRPSNRVGYIVTSRLEKWRPETEAWLSENGIRYDHLIMLDYPDQSTRMHMNTYSAFKAEVYRSTDAVLFVESNIRQAVEIAQLSRRPVLCTDTMQMIQPGSLPELRVNWPLNDRHVPSFSRRVAHKILPENVQERIRSLRKKLRS